VALGDGVGEFDPETDSSPPPSTNKTFPPTTAAGAEGPSDRGALQARLPSARSTASTDCRPTTMASPSATIGAGIPAAWLASPMSVATDQAMRYGGAGADVASPVRAADPWYCGHGASVAAADPATGVIETARANVGSTRRRRRVRKARHPTHGRCGQRRSAVAPESRQADQARHRHGAEERHRIDVGAVRTDPEMQVRHRKLRMSPTGGRDRLPANHVVVLADEHARKPGTRARDAAAVIDREEQASPHLAGERHDAGVRGNDQRADGRRDVDATVTRAVGVVGRIEPTDDRTGDRPHPRSRGVGGRRGPRHREEDSQDRADASHSGDGSGGGRSDP